MQTLVFVNPLRPGKLKEYKEFAAEITGPRKREYIDLLRRYGLKDAKVYYHKIGGREFVIVIHEAENDATSRLGNFASSTHPFDLWFYDQLQKLHEFEGAETQAELLFSFDPRHHIAK